MEKKNNIAEILKDKPKGIRLYSPIFGECAFCYVREDTNDICVKKHNGVIEYFNYEGLYFALGEVMLFPSREMRDWSKFSWMKGDVLVNDDKDIHIIFEAFENNTYTRFKGKHYLWKEGNEEDYAKEETYMLTSRFEKVNDDAVKCYINDIEERLGGKLNRATIEVEKAQPEFKDGDVVVVDEIPFDLYSKCIFILKENLNTGEIKARAYVLYNVNKDSIFFDTPVTKLIERNIRLATEEEKKQFFSALANKGKAWDSKKKKVVNLNPKFDELKPFDKVVVRCSEADRWSIDFFSYRVHNGYICTGDAWFGYCLPYNDETAHLLGTTDDWKGGEG